MQTGQIVLAIFMGLVTAGLGIYTGFAARQKGPVLSNTYLWLSKEQRKHADKKAEYRLVTVIFLGLTLFCLMETLYILTYFLPFLILGFCFIGFDVVYALADTRKRNR